MPAYFLCKFMQVFVKNFRTDRHFRQSGTSAERLTNLSELCYCKSHNNLPVPDSKNLLRQTAERNPCFYGKYSKYDSHYRG